MYIRHYYVAWEKEYSGSRDDHMTRKQWLLHNSIKTSEKLIQQSILYNSMCTNELTACDRVI